MQFVSPVQGQFAIVLASQSPDLESLPTTDVTPEDVRQMMTYLRKAKERALAIRDHAPAGSYMESVLTKTIDGITLELSQLDYLLARKPEAHGTGPQSGKRMRPAI
jgi:hypothetical protein